MGTSAAVNFWNRNFHWLALGYCSFVLLVDALATGGLPFSRHFSFFTWRPGHGVDLFKIIFWFVVPVLLFGYKLDLSYIRPGKVNRRQWLLFGLFLILSFSAAWSITLFDDLEKYYRHKNSDPYRYVIFLGSWFFGWQFINRFLLLTVWDKVHPKGWLVVPALETVYHVVKPLPEMLGMAAFSIVLCLWVKRTGSILFPVIFHLAVELGLWVFLYNRAF